MSEWMHFLVVYMNPLVSPTPESQVPSLVNVQKIPRNPNVPPSSSSCDSYEVIDRYRPVAARFSSLTVKDFSWGNLVLSL